MAKNTIKRMKSNTTLETNLATAMRLLREARAHIGAEMLGDERYIGAVGWDDEPIGEWFAEVDQLVGPAFVDAGFTDEVDPSYADE